MAIQITDGGANIGNTVNCVLGGVAPANDQQLLLAFIHIIVNAIDAFPSSVQSSGFNLIDVIGLRFGYLAVLKKVAGASEPATYTFDWTGGNIYNSGGVIFFLSGADPDAPNGTQVKGTDTGDDLTWNFGALNTVQPNSLDLVIVAGSGENSPASGFISSWSSSLVELADVGDSDYFAMGIGGQIRTSAGSQSAGAATLTDGDQQSVWMRMEIFEAGAGISATVVPPPVQLNRRHSGRYLREASGLLMPRPGILAPSYARRAA